MSENILNIMYLMAMCYKEMTQVAITLCDRQEF